MTRQKAAAQPGAQQFDFAGEIIDADLRLFIKQVAVQRMAIAGAVADHYRPVLAELLIAERRFRAGQRVVRGDHENVIQRAKGLP